MSAPLLIAWGSALGLLFGVMTGKTVMGLLIGTLAGQILALLLTLKNKKK